MTAQNNKVTQKHKSSLLRAAGFSVLISIFALALPATAQVKYWDSLQTKTGTGGGGTGNWDTSSLSWYPGSGNTDQAWSNSGTTNTATFAGAAGIVTLTSGISANRLIFNVDGYTITNNTLTLNGTASTFEVKSGTATIHSALAGNGLTVSGRGTLVLAGANTYLNTTIINGGSLTLDFSQSSRTIDILNPASTKVRIDFNGGTLRLIGKSGAANSQSFINAPNGFSIRAGCSVILTQNGANSLDISMLGIARNVGGTLGFTLPATGGVALTNGIANTILNGPSGGGPFATVGGNDWAAKDATNSKIVPGSSISGFYTPSTATSLSDNADVASGIDTTLSAHATPTSLRFNVPEARTITMTGTSILTPRGILVTANVGNNLTTITGGQLRAPSFHDLVIFQNNTANSLTIHSQIVNASAAAAALTKSGPGLLTLSGANLYTGVNYLNDGPLSISANNNLGDPAAGGGITFGGGTLLATETLSLDNGGVNARIVSLIGKGGTFAIRNGKTLTVLGTISDSNYGAGPLTVGTDGETGTLVLSGVNTYTEPTTVQAGTLVVNSSIISPVIVRGGAVLSGTGSIAAATPQGAVTVKANGILDPGSVGGIGTMSVTGDLALETDSKLQVQVNKDNTDLLTVSGNVTGSSSPIMIEATGIGAGPWLVMTAASISPEFVTSDATIKVGKRANDSELWLWRDTGTVVIVR